MQYDIIATLGPSSATPADWQALLAAGATAFRLNTSHLSLEQLSHWLEKLEAFRASLTAGQARHPIVLDLQGSKWRLGSFPACTLVEGQAVTLVHAAAADHPNVLPVPHADFFRAAPFSSGTVVLNDAKILLALEDSVFGAAFPAGDALPADGTLRATVTRGGEISPHKGITFSDSTYRSETLSEKDRAIFEQTRGMQAIRYAISYIKDGAEMAAYRALAESILGRPEQPDRLERSNRPEHIHRPEQIDRSAYLIAKLERGPAMEDAAQIAAAADEVWVCRGDLGAELGLPAMAAAVQRFTRQISRLSVPAIMAGQVLEHMTAQPVPTRSEVCYLYDSLTSGYRGFVLSDETAIGQFPIEACKTAALFHTI